MPGKQLLNHCSPQLLLRAPDDVTVGEIKQVDRFMSEAKYFGNVQVFEWHPSDPAVLVAGLANGQLVGSSSSLADCPAMSFVLLYWFYD